MAITIKQALEDAKQRLVTVSESASIDAGCLLGFVLQKPLTYLRTWPEQELFKDDEQAFLKLVQRREQGEPVAHLIGSKEFWSHELRVSKDTLIPRPETEMLVEQAIAIAKQQAVNSILELGTGSGAISIALVTELRKTQQAPRILATDNSEAALQIAQQNIEKYCSSIELVKSDWFATLKPERFDLIISNPPYIEENDAHLKQGDVRFEPISALASGEDGLDALLHIIEQAKKWLNPNGWLLLEHGYNQAGKVRLLLEDNGYTQITTLQDLAQNDRVTLALCD